VVGEDTILDLALDAPGRHEQRIHSIGESATRMNPRIAAVFTALLLRESLQVSEVWLAWP